MRPRLSWGRENLRNYKEKLRLVSCQEFVGSQGWQGLWAGVAGAPGQAAAHMKAEGPREPLAESAGGESVGRVAGQSRTRAQSLDVQTIPPDIKGFCRAGEPRGDSE